MRALVLAGGLGTRLREAVPDRPKCLAPVAGRPFIDFILDRLARSGCTEVILAVSHLREAIMTHVGSRWGDMSVTYAIEVSPLGTGGAIRHALAPTKHAPTLVLNGDTWLELDYRAILAAHEAAHATLTMAVVPVADTARYGSVEIDAGRVVAFREKGGSGAGLINGGAYVLAPGIFTAFSLPAAFSFENDFLRPHLAALMPLAFEAVGAFIDIGVPDSWREAQALLATR
jgi:D-glycero-alpha-D-manno-heptose 1-phosphate guanylyltransferase